MYRKSARIYDLLYAGAGIKDFAFEADQLHEIAARESPGAKTLLDVACGTGAHLALLRRWYAVEGVDASEAMLEVARRRLPDVPLHQADMRTLEIGRTFDVVTCLFSSIGYITERDELAGTIGRLAAHVAPGGVLILDGWVRPDAWNDDHHVSADVAEDGGTSVARVSFSRRTGDITEIEMHHLVRTDGNVEYFVENHRLRLAPTVEYVAAVEAAGLRASVMPDYMPHRDRVVGVRPRGQGLSSPRRGSPQHTPAASRDR
jgi:SAM-dependent methyltransferase